MTFARRFDPLLLLATVGLCLGSIAAVRVSAHPEFAIVRRSSSSSASRR